MLFNSYQFIFVFLPIALIGFYMLGMSGKNKLALIWLVIASFAFYAYWNPPFLLLLLASMAVNYAFGNALGRLVSRQSPGTSKLLAFAIFLNLANIGYFKYANFFVDNFTALTGIQVEIHPVFLPLAISFYTFQQIAYLVEVSRGYRPAASLLEYAPFVSFFPHLIAGPILNPKQILPQFEDSRVFRLDPANLAIGLTFFTMGLFKKVVLADGIAPYASPVFAAADAGIAPGLFEAWGGALAYTFQLYFDFSGYSDMAIGLGCMFNIRLPINFNSPYKAVNIIDFWRRWHITLSHLLRDYVYVALGGNRRGPARRYLNLFATMLLGGLWHGAGWTYVIWGGLHGVYLIANHGWLRLRAALGVPAGRPSWWGTQLGRAITLLAVIVGWVFFKASSLTAAVAVLAGMAGLNGSLWPVEVDRDQVLLTALLFAIALLAPNTQEIMGYGEAEGQRPRGAAAWVRWSPSGVWAAMAGIALVYSVTQLSNVQEFLYFQF